jgi:hypothetical protein
VKLILALALLGLAVAGCGSGKKAQSQYVHTVTLYKKSGPITVTGTTTIADVKTGTWIKCKGWTLRGVKVPPPGSASSVGETKMSSNGIKSSGPNMQMTRQQNGSLTVACTPFH